MLNHSPSARAAVAMMAIVLFAPPLFAQPKMEEITVTARKTEESLQEVPISISAFTGTQMRDRGIQNNYGVAAFTPNFNTSQRVGRQLDRPTIRGMANPASRGEPNASYFIDGIFVSSSISTATTQSMERVEVLRGPQSAQFGRATFSGAINYVTRRPTNEYEGDIFLRYGTHEDRQIGAWFSGPIIEDKLMFLVSGNQQNYGGQWNNDLPPLETGELRPINSGDPFFDRVFEVPGPEGNPEGPPDTTVDQLGLGDNSSIGEEKTTDLLVKLMWTPFDSTEVTAKYGYTEGEDSHFTSNVLPTTLGDSGFPGLNCYLPDDPSQPWYGTSIGDFCGEQTIEGAINRLNIPDINYGLTVADNGFNGPLPPETKTAQPARPGLGRETHRFLGEWVQDIGDWTSTLRAAHNEDTFDAAYDFDKQDARAVWGLFAFVSIDEVEDDQFEWSIASPVDKPIRGRLGVFWYERDRSFIQRSITGPEPVFGQLPGTLFPAPRLEGTENQAVFGSLSFDLAPNWRLDFEGRYAEDTKIITGNQISSETEELTVVNAEQAFSNFTPRVTLNWQPTDDLLIYTLAAKGNKPGGFNNEFFRDDVPAEFTEFVLDCTLGDTITIPQTAGRPLTYECTEQLKDDIAFDEEEQWTYEAGIKSTWLDRQLTANLSVFYIDWTNQSVFALTSVPRSNGDTPITILRNAGKSKITGFELETNWIATDGLYLFLNYGLSDGEFTEGFLPGLAETTGGDGNIAGNKIPDTPKHSVITGFEATAQAGRSTDAFLRTDFIFETKKYGGASNFNWIGKRNVVNLRTGLRGPNWTFTVYVQNLTDDDTPLNASDFVNFLAAPISTDPALPNDGDAPRLYAIIPQRGRDVGAEFSYRFGP